MHAANAINYCCSQLEFVIDVAFLCIEICWKCLNNKQNRWFIHFIGIFCIMCSFPHSLPTFANHFWLLTIEEFSLHALTLFDIINVTSFRNKHRYKLRMTNLFMSHNLWHPHTDFYWMNFPPFLNWIEHGGIRLSSNSFNIKNPESVPVIRPVVIHIKYMVCHLPM